MSNSELFNETNDESREIDQKNKVEAVDATSTSRNTEDYNMEDINFKSSKQEEIASCSESQELLSAQRAQELKDNYLPSSLPLQRELAPPKPFPFDALGPVLGPVAKRIHEVVKAPDSICGQSILAAASLITQAHADISIDGRTHPLSLFMLTAAESGDRKSAVDNIVLKPIREYEKMLNKSLIEEMREYKNKFDVWKKERELLMRKNQLSGLEDALNKMDQEPKRPLEPYLLLEEPSYEGLVKLLAIGQPSIGLFSAEGGRMLGGYAMGKENMLKTACGLSSLWDGSTVTRIRAGDDSLFLYGRRFSSHLMVQEVVLAEVIKNEMLNGQGLLARCLIVAPVSNAGNRSYTSVDILQDPLIRAFYSHVSSLLDRAYPLASPDIKNELAPRLLELSQDAKKSWILFHDDIDRALQRNGKLYNVRRSANKAAEQALRIAGVLTLIESFDATEIPLDALEKAIELVRFYLNEALRIADMSGLDPDLELAQAVLEWMRSRAVKEKNKKVFPLKEIYQKAGPRGVRNKKTADKIMKILEEHQAVKRVSQSKPEWQLAS